MGTKLAFGRYADLQTIMEGRRVYSTDLPNLYWLYGRDGKTKYIQRLLSDAEATCSCEVGRNVEPGEGSTCWHALLACLRWGKGGMNVRRLFDLVRISGGDPGKLRGLRVILATSEATRAPKRLAE